MNTPASAEAFRALILPLSVALAFGTVGISSGASAQGVPDYSQEQPVRAFGQQELDQMLAPIALYPDSLLSQMLMAATYPMEVSQAARWSHAYPNLRGEMALRAVEDQNWDPSVKSLVAFPQVLSMMDERLDWTERLGDAFLAQEPQVMDTIQMLRQRAQAAGNLQSTDQLYVQQRGRTIYVEPVNPQMVYVPYYDPTVIYGGWWWPAPPVAWRPWPGYHARPGIQAGMFWGGGVSLSAGYFFGRFDWPQRRVYVMPVTNRYNTVIINRGGGRLVSESRPREEFTRWRHDPQHRGVVPYRDAALRQQFVSSTAAPQRPAADSRRETEQRQFAVPVARQDPPRLRAESRATVAPPIAAVVQPAAQARPEPRREAFVRQAEPARVQPVERAQSRQAEPAIRHQTETRREPPANAPEAHPGRGWHRESRNPREAQRNPAAAPS